MLSGLPELQWLSLDFDASDIFSSRLSAPIAGVPLFLTLSLPTGADPIPVRRDAVFGFGRFRPCACASARADR